MIIVIVLIILVNLVIVLIIVIVIDNSNSFNNRGGDVLIGLKVEVCMDIGFFFLLFV